MTLILIWSVAGLSYLAFLWWYVGIKAKVNTAEVEHIRNLLSDDTHCSAEQISAICNFLGSDNGKDFVMVNLLELKAPIDESRIKLKQYQKVFLGNLFKRAGHPVLFGAAAGGNIEDIGCENLKWTGTGMVRYRSRRDLYEMMLETVGSPHHQLKLDALERTFAFPAAPWLIVGGPKLIVPLALTTTALLLHLLLG